MNETPSSSDKPSAPVYETPSLQEFGTLLDLTLGGGPPIPEGDGGSESL